jgi:arginase family enzyme
VDPAAAADRGPPRRARRPELVTAGDRGGVFASGKKRKADTLETVPAAHDDRSISLAQARQPLAEIKKLSGELQGGKVPATAANSCSSRLCTTNLAQEHPNAVVLYFDAHGDFNTPEMTDTRRRGQRGIRAEVVAAAPIHRGGG